MGGNALKNIVGVRFRKLGKIYFFDPQFLIIKRHEFVVVESTDGEEIAEVACFLLSDASKCISGEVIACDAGEYLSSYVR